MKAKITYRRGLTRREQFQVEFANGHTITFRDDPAKRDRYVLICLSVDGRRRTVVNLSLEQAMHRLRQLAGEELVGHLIRWSWSPLRLPVVRTAEVEAVFPAGAWIELTSPYQPQAA